MQHYAALLRIIVVVAAFGLLTACSDDPASSSKSKRDLLLAGPWKLQSAVRVDNGEDRTAAFAEDLAEITFHSDGTVTGKGSDGDTDTSTWMLTENDTKLVFENGAEPTTILVLTESELKLRVPDFEDDDDGDQADIDVAFRH